MSPFLADVVALDGGKKLHCLPDSIVQIPLVRDLDCPKLPRVDFHVRCRGDAMAIQYKNYPLNAGEYVKQKSKKTHVVWHGTLGRTSQTPVNGVPGKATTSIDGWNNDNLGRVGATYLVDRDGTVYRCFAEENWVFHLGLKNTNGVFDKSSVGIELANELGLLPDGGKLYAFGKINKNTQYVGKSFKQTWRGFDHWAELDEAQVDAAIELTLEICNRNKITPKFYKPSTTYDYPDCFTRATIICHSNCRKDKTDLIMKDWVWDKIADAGIAIIE